MSNFSFLNEEYPNLARLGELGEKYLYQDSNSTFMKIGVLGENMVLTIFKLEDLDSGKVRRMNNCRRINELRNANIVPNKIADLLHVLRQNRNAAAHRGYESVKEAKEKLKVAYDVSVWFMETYVDENFVATPFVLPKKEEQITKLELDKLERKYLSNVKKYEEALIRLKSLYEGKDKSQCNIEREKLRERGKRAADKLRLTKSEIMLIVENQLNNMGWETDINLLSYSNGARPQKNINRAISKWPTKVGTVDFALFCGEKLVGFLNVKDYFYDISKELEDMEKYAKNLEDEHTEYTVGNWDESRVPFLFAANSRGYVEEFKENSGIHLLNYRSGETKILNNWYTPQNILDLLEIDIEKANKALDRMSFDFLKEQDGVSLRYYQVEAIEAVERAIKNGCRTALINMATGTGKTRTILGLIYRLLEANRFKRILFLVDRTSLGNQALDTFDEVKVRDLLTLNQIYNINRLYNKTIDPETRVHVATVQSMIRRILYNDDKMPGVCDYDLIIVDEVHRGYILDREIEAEDLIYMDYADFLSKYKRVVDYFDAVKVGLTATPALHTIQLFGEPVYKYTYRQAVIDGYLVDHEPPHIISTKLSTEGVHLGSGQIVKVQNEDELLETEYLEDDIVFDVDDFNKKIIFEAHTREALNEVTKNIKLDSEGKTLIFATNDLHADMIVKILKEIYSNKHGSIDEDSILKITSKIDKPEMAIKKFKNEKYPKIVVTVDLLTTGIDVPKIDKLVFLRRVKSRILYEQMLGRATRLCDEINKTHFEIYDCVNLYETLYDVSDMKPVVVDSTDSFSRLHAQLGSAENVNIQRKILNKIIAKLQRRKRDLRKDPLFEILSTKNIDEYIIYLKGRDIAKVSQSIIDNRELIEHLDNKKEGKKIIVAADFDDEVIEHTRGYGKNKNPKDYLMEFESYIKENINKVVALNVLCNNPKDMTRNDLKAIKSILDGEGFSEEYLKTAYRDMTNREITADIVAFVRQKAIGSALISREERVKKAMEKIKADFNFTQVQLKYLTKIEKYLLKEVVIDRDVFEMGNFKRDGGFKRYNNIFEENLDKIIDKLKEYMFDDKLA